jgi:hypothetical protein
VWGWLLAIRRRPGKGRQNDSSGAPCMIASRGCRAQDRRWLGQGDRRKRRSGIPWRTCGRSGCRQP